ncbi:VTT domain-containing protein [Candidatus Electrothrix sp.]|uniref:VTT domain-containing protein n=2 Tax=Candidatus Electrothrix sp. TaxID=2170559 RepID=UPI0040562758
MHPLSAELPSAGENRNICKTNNILIPETNCWQLDRAEKLAFLIDAEAYFQAFREAAEQAQEHIYICGWDIDSRMQLARNKQADCGSLQLGIFLSTLAEEKKDLQIYILIWDFVRFMGIDREWFSQFKISWNNHRNIHFHMDRLHPVGASVHHKLVVVDDTVACCGGLDLTKARWDTPAHAPDDQRRRTPDGHWYRPHHDAQMLVEGLPARRLGSYFRDRWQQVTGEQLSSPTSQKDNGKNSPWPASVRPDIRCCRTAIARTQPQHEKLPGVYEAEQLYLDSIRSANRSIYIENQYLTASKVIEALARRLGEPKGPEIILVLPYTTDGWLSQTTMDTLRDKAVISLQEADIHNRLGIFYAYQEGLEGDDTIKIHSKLMIVDNRFIRVGSSNLNNRSMGFDTECDLAVELDGETADGEDTADPAEQLRTTLLAEHLGTTPAAVRQAVQRTDSILRAITELQGGSRTLKKFNPGVTPSVDFIAEEQQLFDPERPVEPKRFLSPWIPRGRLTSAQLRLLQAVGVLLLLGGLAAVWYQSPTGRLFTPNRLQDLADLLVKSDYGWLYVAAAYLFGSLVMVPITLLISLTILVFGTYKGFAFALFGSVLSGATTYGLGRVLGRQTVRALAGDTINNLSRKLGRRGVLSTFLVRLVPVAPYTVVNIVAGASHIRFTDFLLGTLLGMLPGILAIAGIVDRGYALFREPNLFSIATSLAVLALILGSWFLIQKKLRSD